MNDSKRTVLYDRHVALGARMVDFAGWMLPVQYEGILAEHKHCRTSAALFDICHMGQLRVTGPQAAEKLAGVISQDAVKLPVGRSKYGFLLNDDGCVIDDAILMRLAKDDFLLVVNAGTTQTDIDTLNERLTGDVTLEHLADWGKLDLQGPASFDVLSPLFAGDLAEMKYFDVRNAHVKDLPCILGRTGYTGELGYEIFAANEHLPAIMDALLANPAVAPAGLGARDSLRLEMAYALYGHELDDETTPLEADMGFFFNMDRDFVGAEALRKQAANGVGRKLVALATKGRRRFNPGDEIIANGEVVGLVTSSAFSPSLEAAIGMGYVTPAQAEEGQALTVRTPRCEIETFVAPKPIYTNGTCRKKL